MKKPHKTLEMTLITFVLGKPYLAGKMEERLEILGGFSFGFVTHMDLFQAG